MLAFLLLNATIRQKPQVANGIRRNARIRDGMSLIAPFIPIGIIILEGFDVYILRG